MDPRLRFANVAHMQFLAMLRRRTEAFSDAQFADMLGPEADRARALYAEGRFRAIYSRADLPGAVIMVEAADADDAANVVGTLPFVLASMADVTLVPLLPYRGFI